MAAVTEDCFINATTLTNLYSELCSGLIETENIPIVITNEYLKICLFPCIHIKKKINELFLYVRVSEKQTGNNVVESYRELI